MKRLQLLYVTSSSYSGSTLLAFLLNTHPQIFTVSEMIGWDFRDDEDFKCSCGEPLDRCAFFTKVAHAFREQGLPFKINRFGTAFQLVINEKLNRYLTASLPRCHNSWLERMRDTLVWHLPGLRSRLDRIGRANRLFVETALAHSGASIFADVSKDPHRIRQLSRLPGFDLSILYLVRDIRGVVVSNMRERANDVRKAARIWLQDQHDILRVLQEYPGFHTLFYEDLCQDTNAELAKIHNFLSLNYVPYPGNFKSGEHHILGNSMRAQHISTITLDEKWKLVLSKAEINQIKDEALSFLNKNSNTPARFAIEHYLQRLNY